MNVYSLALVPTVLAMAGSTPSNVTDPQSIKLSIHNSGIGTSRTESLSRFVPRASNPANGAAGGLMLLAQNLTPSDGIAAAGNSVRYSFRQGLNGYVNASDAAISNAGGGNGTGTTGQGRLLLNGNGADTYRGLLRFRSLNIPASLTVLTATLSVTMESSAPFEASAYVFRNSWQPQCPTLGWQNRGVGLTWAAPGGDGQGTDLVAGIEVAGRERLTSTGMYAVGFTLPSQLVQEWISNPATNQGLQLRITSSTRPVYLYSSSYETMSKRPQLDITTAGALPPDSLVTISPQSPAPLAPGGLQQFYAYVFGIVNTAVTWAVSPAVGTITPAGLYTAPAALAAPQTVTITATTVSSKNKSASVSLSLVPSAGVGISVSPASAALTTGQSRQFTASVTGTSNTSVLWSMNPAIGALSANGLYTAPQTLSTPQTVTVTARSAADTTKAASAVVTVTPAVNVSVSVTPTAASVTASRSVSLTASVSGTASTGVVWSLSPNVGSISSTGNTAVYLAPSSITASQNVEVVVTSVADPSKFAKAIMTLVPAVVITLSPGAATVPATSTQQFTVSVTGTTNQAVTYSLNPAVGTISAAGLYTAPSTVAATTSVVLTAQSVADPTKKDTSNITIPATPMVTFTIDANRLTSLAYNGQSFYQRPDAIVQSARFRSSTGVLKDAGWNQPSKATLLPGGNAYELVYNMGQPYQFTVRVTWTRIGAGTLRVESLVTNNDPTNTLQDLGLHNIPLKLPGPAREYKNNQPLEANQFSGYPVSFLSGTWGSVAMWQGGYPSNANLVSYYSSATQTVFGNFLTGSTTVGPNVYALDILPGLSRQLVQYVKFGAPDDTVDSLAPEGFAEYAAAFPYQVNWPDRRPIAYTMVSEGGKRSVSNPRGYFWDPNLNAGNPSAFKLAMMASADTTLTILNSMSVRPQGIIIWDIEGQEFPHAFTYVGAPDKLGALAPEMEAVADEYFARFTSQGYRVGVALRPENFDTGNLLPTTCVSDPNFYFRDVFILLTAPVLNRGYRCDATNIWTRWGSNLGNQTLLRDYNAVLDVLRQRVRFARSRWGATLFYVDSSLWFNGAALDSSMWRTLSTEFPGSLFIPEITNNGNFGATAPYNWRGGNLDRVKDARQIWPQSFQSVSVADMDFALMRTKLIELVRGGDLLLFPAFGGSPSMSAVSDIYTSASR